MLIPFLPRYDITTDGIVTSASSGERLLTHRNRFGKIAVRLGLSKNKHKSFNLARLVLSTFDPKAEDTDWLSVKFKDGNEDNCKLENLEWVDEWFEPEGIPGVTHPLGARFSVPGVPDLEVTHTGVRWEVFYTPTGAPLTIHVGEHGYEYVRLPDNKKYLVHRLVCMAFIRHPLDTYQLAVNHKDSVKLNNALSNLEWATYAQNSDHSYAEGGGRSKVCRRVRLYDLNTGISTSHPSINDVARMLDSNPGHIHGLLTHRGRRGMGYKGFLLKYEDDNTPWSEIIQDTKKNTEPYRLVLKDTADGSVRKYNSLMEIMRAEGINPKTIYRLLRSEYVLPWNGKLIQTDKPDLKWPDYPPALVAALSACKNTARPIQITHPDGTVEYSSGVTDWCMADRENRCDPAVLSRAIATTGKWRDYCIKHVDLSKYS